MGFLHLPVDGGSLVLSMKPAHRAPGLTNMRNTVTSGGKLTWDLVAVFQRVQPKLSEKALVRVPLVKEVAGDNWTEPIWYKTGML